MWTRKCWLDVEARAMAVFLFRLEVEGRREVREVKREKNTYEEFSTLPYYICICRCAVMSHKFATRRTMRKGGGWRGTESNMRCRTRPYKDLPIGLHICACSQEGVQRQIRR